MVLRSVFLAVLLGFSVVAEAGSTRLGDVRLTDATDRDLLTLGPCSDSSNRPIQRLKLRVTEYRAQIDRLVVEFGNGDRQTLSVKKHFDVNEESRWIDMEGPARCVRKIGIVGDTDTARRAPGKQARVAFWGDVAGADAGRPAADASPRGEARTLGRMKLSDQPDRDVLDLPRCPSEGNAPVTQLKLKVAEHPAEIKRVRVVFESGAEEVVELGRVLPPGTDSGWRDLPGEARCIDRIIVVGDTESVGFRPGKQARVTFMGR